MSLRPEPVRTPPAPGPIKPAVPPELWLGPVLDALDWDALGSPEHGAVIESVCSTVQVYQSWLLERNADRQRGPDRYDLVQAGIFERLKAAGLKLAIEAPAVKTYSRHSEATTRDMVAETVSACAYAQYAGTPVSYVCLDEPLTGGLVEDEFREGNRPCEPREVLDRMQQYIEGVHGVYPDVKIAWIEGFQAEQYFAWDEPIPRIDDLQRRGIYLDALHLDIDPWVWRGGPPDRTPENRTLVALWGGRLRQMRDYCRARHIALGVIGLGHAADPSQNDHGDQGWYDDAMVCFRLIQRAFGDDWCERVICQSWGEPPTTNGDGGFTIPRILGAHGHLALALEIARHLR